MSDAIRSTSLPDWVRQFDDPENQKVREIYALAGLALYCAQVLDHGIVNILTFTQVLRIAKGKKALNEEQVNAYFDRLSGEHFQKTLGSLIKSIESVGVHISEDVRKDLAECLRFRNRLAHHFFRERAEQFLTEDGKRLMAGELRKMEQLFTSTDRKLQPIQDRLAGMFGITPDRIDHIVELMKSGAPEATIRRELKRPP